MRSKGVVMVMALVMAGAATVAVYAYVNGVKEDTRAGGESVSVVVAKDDIPAGASLADVISDGGFTTMAVPESTLVDGVITQLGQLEGRRAGSAIVAGEQIPATRLQGSTGIVGGALGIPEGHVATTVPLEPWRLVGGAIRTGDHVTVFGSFDGNGGVDNAMTVAVVPDAQVLKVSTSSVGVAGGGGAIQVTLALSPRDAQRVVFTGEQGNIWLSLIPVGQKASPLPPVTIAKGIR